MTEVFKSNMRAHRHCILFEVLQGSSIHQAYKNICSVIGKDVIDYKNFELSFNQFSKEFNDKKKEKSIAEIFRDDKYALRVCILYEFLKYQRDKLSTPIFEIFVNFCKVIGVEDVLKYPEFDFWYYRFLNGEYDSNFERDKDKKIYELMDMPIDVMKNIVEYLDILDRMKLAKTSRSLHTFVEDQKLFHHTLGLIVSSYSVTISLDKWTTIKYIENCTGRYKNFTSRPKCVECVYPLKKASLDLKSILKNPKLHLDSLKIKLSVYYTNVLNGLEDAFKFTHYLNVKNLIVEDRSQAPFSRILPFLKPGYLTTIDITIREPEEDAMNIVFETEQWKQAKYFVMTKTCFFWPQRHLYHFKEFHVWLLKLTVEDFRQMKEILFKSPDFEKCELFINFEVDRSIFDQEFGNSLRGYPGIYHYPIPNSTDYFEIVDRGFEIYITRKKK